MDFSLLMNAVIAGLLLGAFYAAVTVGISISFGMLDVVNIAHPAFIILGSYIAYIVNTHFGLDPIVGQHHRAAGLLCARRRGLSDLLCLVREARPGLAARPRLLLRPAVRHRSRSWCWSSASTTARSTLPISARACTSARVELPLRLLVPCVVSLVMFAGLQIFLGRTFIGRAVMAVSQDPLALRLMAVDPTRIKRIAFAISIATASLAGAFLIIIQPVIPSVGRDYIGRIFAICVLGGLGSLPGTLIAALLLGVIESITATFYGPSWAPAVSFGILLLTLAVRPSGLLGR